MSMPDREESLRYEQLVALEEHESLLEELEEQSLTGSNPGEHIPEALRERMTRLGVRDVQQLRDQIMRLHARLDDSDDDLTITES